MFGAVLRRRVGPRGVAWVVAAGVLAVIGVAPIAVWTLAVVAWLIAADR